MDRPLQELFKVHCFGCGVLNPQGMQIRSLWDGEDLLCRWRPAPHHIGHPGLVYGGTIASAVDCHCIWTALAHDCRDRGHALEDGPPAFGFVTGSLKVDFLKPMPIEGEMVLRARVCEKRERKTVVTCSVHHSGIECARAEVVAVRIPLNPMEQPPS